MRCKVDPKRAAATIEGPSGFPLQSSLGAHSVSFGSLQASSAFVKVTGLMSYPGMLNHVVWRESRVAECRLCKLAGQDADRYFGRPGISAAWQGLDSAPFWSLTCCVGLEPAPARAGAICKDQVAASATGILVCSAQQDPKQLGFGPARVIQGFSCS